jgi:hypothetical protein
LKKQERVKNDKKDKEYIQQFPSLEGCRFRGGEGAFRFLMVSLRKY